MFQHRLIPIFFSITILCKCVSASPFDQFKEKIESKLFHLRDRLQTQFTKLCESQLVDNSCPILSSNMCSGTSQKSCISDFPTRSSCIGEGAFLSEISGIRYPNHIHEKGQFSTIDQQFTCASALIEEDFNKIGEDRNFSFGFSYIASRSGAFRCFPSFSDTGIQGCTDYDHRYRPWYKQALSGYKNLIIVLDNSINTSDGSMGAGITLIKTILSTAGDYDFIQILVFNQETSYVHQEYLTQMSEKFREQAIYQVVYISSTKKSANFEKAFIKIGEIIENEKTMRNGAPCQNPQNIIFFMSAGIINEGVSNSEQLKTIISRYSTNNKIHLFTFALGSNAQTQILSDLSCEFNGIMFTLNDSELTESQTITATQAYFNFIYSGTKQQVPFWSDPYQDTFGYGNLVSVSLPVYYNRGDMRQYLALVVFDIQVSYLQKFTTDTDSLLKNIQTPKKCQQYLFSPCEMQKFRYENAAPVCSTPQINSACVVNNSICVDFPLNLTILNSEDNTDTNQCCSLTVGGLLGIILGSMTFMVIIGVCIYRIRRKKLKKLKRRQKKIESIKKSIKRQNLNFSKKRSSSNLEILKSNKIQDNQRSSQKYLDEENSQVQRCDVMVFQNI